MCSVARIYLSACSVVAAGDKIWNETKIMMWGLLKLNLP